MAPSGTAASLGFLTFSHGLLPGCGTRSVRAIDCVCPAQDIRSTTDQGYTRIRPPFLDIWCVVSHSGTERRFFETYENVFRWKGPLGVSVISRVVVERDVHGVCFTGGSIVDR